MISPEILKRYDDFERLDENRLKAIAEIAEEGNAAQGDILFKEKQPAEAFYFVIEGYIDLVQKTVDPSHPNISKEMLVGGVQPREIFGLSAIVEPYLYKATARASQPCHFIKFDGPALRALIDEDCFLGFVFMRQISVALNDRLMDSRVQLAAAWVESQAH